MKHLLTLSLCLVASLALVNPALADDDWELASKSDGVVVHTRRVEGSSLREFKASAVIPAPIEDVIKIFRDPTTYTTWMHNVVEAKSLGQDDTKGTGYVRMDFPFPVSDRDSIVTMTRIGNDPNEYIFEGEPKPDLLPERSGVVRIRELEVRWEFRARKDGKTDVTYFQHANPGGYVPSALLNRTVVDQPNGTLSKLIKLTRSRTKPTMSSVGEE